MEAAAATLHSLGIVILVCNYGKHRSLSLEHDLSCATGACLVSTRDDGDQSRYCAVARFIELVREFLRPFVVVCPGVNHPVRGVRIADQIWDGDAWAQSCAPAPRPGDHYISFCRGDIVILLRPPDEDDHGWQFGFRVAEGGHARQGWFPPLFVRAVTEGDFPGTPDPFSALTALTQWSYE